MIASAAILTALLVCAPQTDAVVASAVLTPVGGSSVPDSSGSDSSGSGSGSGAGAQIGRPLHFTITLAGKGAAGAKLASDALELGYAWSVVDGPRDAVDLSLPAANRADVRLQWTIIALESGSAATPPVDFKLSGGEVVVVPAATIEILPELAEAEDAPRPLRGFRDVEDRRLGDPRLVLAAMALLLALPFLIIGFVRYRRRPRPGGATAHEVTPQQAIDALDAAGDPRGTMSALGPLLRRALDGTRGCDDASLTDAEWTAALQASEGFLEEDRRAATELVHELSTVRFGGGDPTSFAAKDAVERARRLAALSAEPSEVSP